MHAGLRRLLGAHPHVGDIRGLGLMATLELVEDRATKRPFDAARKIGPQVLAALRERGVITRGRGDQVYLGPPFVIGEDMLDRMVGRVGEAVTSVLGPA
jgi:adenosylmethionine-8-amino-7-oxononanoate aminotransferase